jgi:hypothetical protein
MEENDPQKSLVFDQPVRDLICEAIRARKLLHFNYGNQMRLVEPHFCGIDAAHHDVLSAYLVSGYSESGQQPYWRFYLASKMTELAILEAHFHRPREGYKPDDPRFMTVYCQLSPE